MKAPKLSKLRYYYSRDLGVLMPVPVKHRLKYLVFALIVAVVAAASIFFIGKSTAKAQAPDAVSQDHEDAEPQANPQDAETVTETPKT